MRAQSHTKKQREYFGDEEQNLGAADFDEVQDKQYQNLMPNKKGSLSSLSYFKNSEKYSGKIKQQNDEQLKEESLSEQQQKPEQNGIKIAFNQIKNKRKQRSKLLEQDLKAIDQEDRDNMELMKNNQKQQGNPQALQNQLNQFNKLTQIRYYSQKNIESLKKYPTKNFPVEEDLHNLHKKSEKVLISSLQHLVNNYEKLAADYFVNKVQKKIQLTTVIETNESKRLNVESIWQKFEEETKDLNQKLEEEIINWSQRTTLLRNSSSRSQYNSLLMQTPVGQAKKAIQDWQKVSKKCQQKRTPIRILFENQQNLRQNSDPSIYDDQDLLQEVQKNYEQEIQNGDKDFLMADTLKYLENKSKTKVSKDVDRKASKNRKIRYNVHPKILNFMPAHNQNLLEARDEIVKNLFNKGTQINEIEDYIDI